MATRKVLLFTLGMLAATQAAAQSLYKCTADGKVTYQSMPCAQGGEVLAVPPPPSPTQVREAQARNEEARQQVQLASERARLQREKDAKDDAAKAKEEAGKRAAPGDCAKLKERRAVLYGERNNHRRNANLDAMGKTQDEIDRLEADYTKGSCGPLD